jgi:hypothetical protein
MRKKVEGAQRRHTTCIDVTAIGERWHSQWVCGPDCPTPEMERAALRARQLLTSGGIPPGVVVQALNAAFALDAVKAASEMEELEKGLDQETILKAKEIFSSSILNYREAIERAKIHTRESIPIPDGYRVSYVRWVHKACNAAVMEWNVDTHVCGE